MDDIIRKRFFHKDTDLALQVESKLHGWHYKRQSRPITDRDIERHLRGFHTVACYPVREGNTSAFLAIDID